MKRKTTEYFIEKAREIHGYKYDYSLAEYKNNKTKIKIICPKHGLFEQIAYSHYRGGCVKCGGTYKHTTEEFIKKAKEIHNNKYNYSLVDYKNAITKIKIICPEHGIFEQNPNSHLRGYGCSKCKIITNQKFIEKAKKIHGDKYDYSLVDYEDTKTKIKIICSKHGVFEQTPKSHLEGCNCPKCNIITNEIFIKRSKEIHNNKYDYSLVDYKNNNTKIKITCPEHGLFEQTPIDHYKGECPKCANKKRVRNTISTTNIFIDKSRKIHGDKYDYSLVNYINAKTKVSIICSEHGLFMQKPNAHLTGNGCYICKESRGEKIIRQYLKTKDIKYNYQKTFRECNHKYVLRFDFYLPKYKICIEYDGIQHFKAIEWFGGIKSLKEQKKRDNIKNKFCENNDIKLIRIRYDENILEKLTNSLVFQNKGNRQMRS